MNKNLAPSETYNSRKRSDRWFGSITFIPVVVVGLALIFLLISTAMNSLSWQVVTPASSGKTFSFQTGLGQGREIIKQDLQAQDLSPEEVNAVMNDPEEYRKHNLRNRVQLMFATKEGPMRWTVVSIRDKHDENYGLIEGLKNRSKIQAELSEGQQLYLNPWLDASFFQLNASRSPSLTGLKGALMGTLWVTTLVALFVVPIGAGAAIYLEEYAPKNAFGRFLEINIRNLAGVPSIVYGVLGLYLFVRLFPAFKEGQWKLGLGPSVLSAALTLGLLVLPVVVIAAREAIKSVPDSLRQGSYGLGATKWQTVQRVVLPHAAPGIATGLLLAVSRALGETAPLLLVGAAAFVPFNPSGLLSEYTVVPVQIYAWISENDPEFRNISAAAILVLLGILVLFNMMIFQVRRRFGKH